MQQTASLSKKLMRIGAGLLVVALVSIGLTLWVTWQLEGGAAAVNEAGRMRMQTWRLASAVQARVEPAELQSLVARFDESLALLREGDPSRPLFVPWDDQVRARFNDVESLWRTQRPLWLAEPAPAAQDLLQAGAAFVDASDRLVLVIERHLSRLTAILNLFQLLMMVLAIGGAVIMLFTGYMYVINPLAQLREGLRKLESGDFRTRIEVDTVDELARGFAQRVRAVMKADAAAVRWSDDANQRYLMLASDCFPQELVEEERSLLAGACACGNLRPDARTRVIPILSHDEAPVRHCAKAGYESVVTVPIRMQQRLLGEFNLFFRTPILLSADEIELLDALASHLASSLEGLRADALDREAAVAEERALLARNLHDSIAQSLAFLKIQVHLLRTAVQKGQAPQVQGALDELDIGLRESIGDVRELLVHFRTRTNTDDIEQALQETLQKFQSQTGLSGQLQVQGEGLPLPSDVQVQVLHVIQEALSNVRKHAGATQVGLEIHKGERWRFVVRDNGGGFDTAKHPGPSHVGLNIMRERAGRLGAEVGIVSRAGQGTTVTLILPPHPEVSSSAARAAAATPVAAGVYGS